MFVSSQELPVIDEDNENPQKHLVFVRDLDPGYQPSLLDAKMETDEPQDQVLNDIQQVRLEKTFKKPLA